MSLVSSVRLPGRYVVPYVHWKLWLAVWILITLLSQPVGIQRSTPSLYIPVRLPVAATHYPSSSPTNPRVIIMDRLPEELIAYIFDHLEASHALSSAMLVNRRWYMYGARNLHAKLVFPLGYNMAVDSSNVVLSLMRRLVSPTLATAQFIRHLAVFGLANREVQGLLRNVLRQATTLRSLDIQALYVLDNETRLRSDLLSGPDLLPNLSALNIASASSLHALLNARRIRALRVHEPMDHEALTRVVDPSGAYATCIRSLELAISIDRPAAAVEEMEYLISALAYAPLRALALQFVLDRPNLMSWSDFEVRMMVICDSGLAHALLGDHRANGPSFADTVKFTNSQPRHPPRSYDSPSSPSSPQRTRFGRKPKRATYSDIGGTPHRGQRPLSAHTHRNPLARMGDSERPTGGCTASFSLEGASELDIRAVQGGTRMSDEGITSDGLYILEVSRRGYLGSMADEASLEDMSRSASVQAELRRREGKKSSQPSLFPGPISEADCHDGYPRAVEVNGDDTLRWFRDDLNICFDMSTVEIKASRPASPSKVAFK
ncbi:hypothetical protein NUW54_g10940 [Trametes sanguinea]|uniref:Uncharacterized protein n=1 Tax=Trametes sanguinea TaxID=158606 RepID=A0ACC1NPC5_9APHY|nr:hypothetical protein NUW54_g10940 [Trametes sanguinea]